MVYHADRAFFKASEDVTNAPERVLWYEEHRPYVWISTVVAAVGAAWGAANVDGDVLFVGVLIGIGGLLYSAPLPFTSRRIKDIPFLKTLLIVTCWVVGGVVLPTMDLIPTQELLLLASYKSMYIFPNVLLAEWVDRSGDTESGVLTMGARMSMNVIRSITLICVAVSLILLWNWSSFSPRVDVFSIDVLGMLGMLVVIMRSKSWDGDQIIFLDLWVGFGLVTWAFWMLTS